MSSAPTMIEGTLDYTERQIHKAGRPVDRYPSRIDGAFDHDGRSFQRRGSVLVIDGQAWHLGGTGLARYFFKRLTAAAIG